MSSNRCLDRLLLQILVSHPVTVRCSKVAANTALLPVPVTERMNGTHLVELRLALTGGEAMDGMPGCATALHPHGRVRTDAERSDAVALCHQSVTVRLVSAAADAVVSFECMQECPEISFLQNDIGGTTQCALQPKWEG